MKCPKCNAEMVPLFISLVCDNCDYGSSSGLVKEEFGYIVWRNRPPGSCEYVFKTLQHAEKWRAAAGLTTYTIRKVFASTASPFRWRQSSGSVNDIFLADRLYEIFPESNNEAKYKEANKAFLLKSDDESA